MYKENTGGPHAEITLIKNDKGGNCNHFPRIRKGHGSTVRNDKGGNCNHFPYIRIRHNIKEVEKEENNGQNHLPPQERYAIQIQYILQQKNSPFCQLFPFSNQDTVHPVKK